MSDQETTPQAKGPIDRLTDIPQERQRVLAAIILVLTIVVCAALILLPARAEHAAKARLTTAQRALDTRAPSVLDVSRSSAQLRGWYPEQVDVDLLRSRLALRGLTDVERVGLPAERVGPTALTRTRYRLRLTGDVVRMLTAIDELHALARTSPEGLSGVGPRVEVEAANTDGTKVTIVIVVESER